MCVLATSLHRESTDSDRHVYVRTCMYMYLNPYTSSLDLTDLQNFVTVALNRGEDTLTNAKLASLRTVGSGFGYLIFDLTTEADFHSLACGCKFIWEAMKNTPNLAEYLVRLHK